MFICMFVTFIYFSVTLNKHPIFFLNLFLSFFWKPARVIHLVLIKGNQIFLSKFDIHKIKIRRQYTTKLLNLCPLVRGKNNVSRDRNNSILTALLSLFLAARLILCLGTITLYIYRSTCPYFRFIYQCFIVEDFLSLDNQSEIIEGEGVK